MKTRFVLFIVFCLVMGIGLVGCSSVVGQPVPTIEPVMEVMEQPTAEPTAVPEPTVDPAAAIVLDMIERVNVEDYAGAAEFVADDMLAYFIGMPPTGMEIYRGKEQFQTFLEECCTGANFEWEVIPGRVEDGVVYAESKTWMDFTRELGVAPNNWHEVFVVQDGKITQYVSWITKESLAKLKPILREVAPELFESALPTGETPVNEVTITIADGTCAYDGPMTLQAGELTVNVEVQDQNWDKYALSFFTLEADKDMLDLMTSTYSTGPPSWSNMVFLKELAPNESETFADLTWKKGCFIWSAGVARRI